MKCKNCGSEIADSGNFCPKCGTPAAAEPEKKKSPAKAIIAIVLVVAILAGALAAGFLWIYPTFFKEKYLKNKILKETDKDIIELFFDDFNNDGTKEAFAVTGKGDEDDFSKGEIWFASDKACKKVNKNFNGKINGLLEEDDDKYISVEVINDYSSLSYIYGVKDKDKYFEPEISGIFSGVHQDGKKIVTSDGLEVSIKDFKLEEYAGEPDELVNDDIEGSNPIPENIKVGFIFLHDENSTYDKNYMDAAKAACADLGIEFVFKTNISESSACYDAAAELIEEGCNLIFADSFGHEDFLIQAARDFPEVQFCHAAGTKAHTEGLDNYHNAYAAIYEGRYLTGVAAGLKLNELKEAGKLKGKTPKLGFVGSFSYAEVISSYTAFYLGAKSVCPDVTMDVQFTGSWYDEIAEKEASQALIKGKCDIISQYSDSMGAPAACEEAGIPNISYNGSTINQCPNTFIMSSRIDWTPYFKYIIQCVQNGNTIDTDWTGTLATDSVVITDVNESVAANGTQAKLDEVKSGLEDGSIKVFDIASFKVSGKVLDSYEADADTDADYAPDTEAIYDGYFHESEYRSAPYFDLKIDDIKLLNEQF